MRIGWIGRNYLTYTYAQHITVMRTTVCREDWRYTEGLEQFKRGDTEQIWQPVDVRAHMISETTFVRQSHVQITLARLTST